MLRKTMVFVPFIIWFVVIVYLSFSPLTNWPKPGLLEKLYGDKLIHITMYSVLCWCLLFGMLGYGNTESLPVSSWVWGIVLCALIGIVIEILQPLLTLFRHYEIADMAANVAGAVIGALIFKRMARAYFVQSLMRRLT